MKNHKLTLNLICALSLLLVVGLTAHGKPGDLDKTFGNGGIAATPIPNLAASDWQSAYTRNSALQPDGKIVVVGSLQKSNGDIFRPYIARFNSDGSLDTTFGSGGIVVTPFNISTNPAENANGYYASVAVQPDGKIIAAGNSTTNSIYIGLFSDVVMARYNADGSLDANFGNGGKVFTQTDTGRQRSIYGNSVVTSLQIAPDGTFYAIGGGDFHPNDTSNSNNSIVLKYSANGGLLGLNRDINVGVDVSSGGNFYAIGSSSALQPDGKLVYGITGGYSVTNFFLVRVNPDLSPDSTFGTNGIVTTNFGNYTAQANGVVLNPDGKITVSGSSNGGNNNSGNFFAARYAANGNLDATFGNGGKVLLLYTDPPNFPGGTPTASKQGGAIARQPDGKYVVALSDIFGAIRLLQNGAVDTTFGSNGIATYVGQDPSNPSIGGPTTGKILMQPNGKIILTNVYNSIRLVRLNNYARNDRADFDGDGKTDLSVFRGSNNIWYYLNSSNNSFNAAQFGANGDIAASADFDGDGKTDVAVYRPSNGVWYILNSKNNTVSYVNFGLSGDVPVASDFDGDGKADAAVFRPSNGTWYVLGSQNGFSAAQFGQNGDVPMRGDFDGDNKTDFAVFRPSNGAWFILNSSNNAVQGVQFGQNGDVPINADFNGDGKADLAVFRPSNGVWYYANANSAAPAQNFVAAQFGQNGDVPVAGDFDGDGKTDFAVYRNGTWIVSQSSTNQVQYTQFGLGSDKPVPVAY